MAYPKNLEEYREKRGPVSKKEFKDAVKSGAKELVMAVVPVGRVAKLAGKGAKALRKAAEAKVKRLDSFKYLKGHSRFEMGAGAKKLDAIPGLKYIDPEDAGPEARNTLAFLKDHKGGADYRLVKQNGKTKVMAVEVEGIHSFGGKPGTKEVHIFDLGEKNAKLFLGY
tara:strand:+ start:1656 stop:2159 length:504 start_codon:yes stop_codon:yes gene_type:complete